MGKPLGKWKFGRPRGRSELVLKRMGFGTEVVGNGSRSFLLAGFSINDVEPLVLLA
jgi:hypothetical protein